MSQSLNRCRNTALTYQTLQYLQQLEKFANKRKIRLMTLFRTLVATFTIFYKDFLLNFAKIYTQLVARRRRLSVIKRTHEGKKNRFLLHKQKVRTAARTDWPSHRWRNRQLLSMHLLFCDSSAQKQAFSSIINDIGLLVTSFDEWRTMIRWSGRTNSLLWFVQLKIRQLFCATSTY